MKHDQRMGLQRTKLRLEKMMMARNSRIIILFLTAAVEGKGK
jgi:hypothetical protein